MLQQPVCIASFTTTSKAKPITTILFYDNNIKNNKNINKKKNPRKLLRQRINDDPLQIERDWLLQHNDDVNDKSNNNKDNNRICLGVIGSDDCGMGAIAGPIVTVSCCCCCCFSSDNNNTNHFRMIPGVMDSKKLTYNECQIIYNQVISHKDIIWSYAIRTNTEIDQIYGTSQKATESAFLESIQNVTNQFVINGYNQQRHQQTSITLTNDNNSNKKNNNNFPNNNQIKFKLYSIVDGHKSPSSKDILSFVSSSRNTTTTNNNSNNNDIDIDLISRPWKNGDSIVYSVALASIIARVIRHEYMISILQQEQAQQEQKQQQQQQQYDYYYDKWQFQNHGGYPTKQHIELLHQYGISPIHRIACQPVYNVLQTSLYNYNNNVNKNKQQQQNHVTNHVTDNDNVNHNNDDNVHNESFYLLDTMQQEVMNNVDDNTSIDNAVITTFEASSSTLLSHTSTTKNNNNDLRRMFITRRKEQQEQQRHFGISTPTTRRSFVSFIPRTMISTAAAVATSTTIMKISSRQSDAMTIDTKRGIALPDVGEIEAAVPKDWSIIDNPITTSTSQALSRLDSNNDSIFYSEPRFVEHVDEQAVQIITNYITKTIIKQQQLTTTPLAVLDLCSSWTSHIDTKAIHDNNGVSLGQVAGLGMNTKELQANTLLTEWVVQDLNQNPILPYKDNTFDIILLQLSIDYLIRPLEVCSEIGRVLKPNTGTIHIIYSNRLFLSKAVALWTGADDIDHTFTVASYLYFSGNDDNKNNYFDTNSITANDLSNRNKKNKNNIIIGDPVYVVTATKKAVA